MTQVSVTRANAKSRTARYVAFPTCNRAQHADTKLAPCYVPLPACGLKSQSFCLDHGCGLVCYLSGFMTHGLQDCGTHSVRLCRKQSCLFIQFRSFARTIDWSA